MGTKDPVVPVLTEEHVRIISECRRNGMREKFEVVLEGMMNGRMPKNVDLYFCRFIAESEQIWVARSISNHFCSRFGANVRFRRAFGIVMIMAGSEVREILPARELHHQSSSPIRRSNFFKEALKGQRNSRLIT